MIRLFELFAGYGSQSIALKRLGVKFENVGYCEIDKYAIQAYKALHGEDITNYGDITKVDAQGLPDMDLLTYSFPCQDISVAGKGRGFSKDSGTRSSLLWECHKIIDAKRPKYLMMENVKNLVGKKNKPDFEAWLLELDSLGYNNYWKVINAKHCGVPQNRERVFCVSIRKDVDNEEFKFNEQFDNGVRLKDMLESEADEKYYINSEKVSKLILELNNGKGMTNHEQPSGIYLYDSKAFSKDALPGMSRCLKAQKHDSGVVINEQFGIDFTINQPKERDIANRISARNDRGISNLKQEGTGVCAPCLTPDRVEKRQNGRRFKEDGEPMLTLTGQDRHGVMVEEATNNPQRLGNVYGEQFGTGYAGNVWDKEAISPALMTMQGGGRQPHIFQKYRIRKLTPKECFRLMGLNDEEIQKIQDAGISNSQQYKMAGNSIVVDAMFFLKNLF